MYFAIGIGGFIALLIIAVLGEIIISSLKRPSITGYRAEIYNGTGYLLYLLNKKKNGEVVDEGDIEESIENAVSYVNERYDCSDFRVIALIRAIKDFSKQLSSESIEKIKHCLLSFRYWMDQPNTGDSLCMWSENHQLIYVVSEYLVGDMYPDELFCNDNKTGKEHKAMAEKRIDAWLDLRFKYGYSEWNSSNYFPEELAPFANFIQYSTDEARVERMKMALDLLLFDVAIGSFRYKKGDRTYYIFNNTSGRAYADNKVADYIGNHLKSSLDCLIQAEATKDIEDGWQNNYRDRVMLFRLMLEATRADGSVYYELPAAISAVFNADYSNGVELKESTSQDIDEMVSEGLVGHSDKQIMCQLGMEVFTDYRVINNTICYLRKNKMFSNAFVAPFRYINSYILIKSGILKAISKKLPMLPNGAALERANIYTYKTKGYCMSTAQKYNVGGFCGQQHIWSLNITEKLSIFTTHPAKNVEKGGSPSYWIGNGRCPHAIQNKNTLINIYKLPIIKGLGEGEILRMTHAYCPLQFMDDYNTDYFDKGIMFGKAGKVCVMLRTNGRLYYREAKDSIKNDMSMHEKVDTEAFFTDRYDLINDSSDNYHYWIIEVSEEESFEDFIKKQLSKPIEFDEGDLNYNKEFKVTYGGDTFIEGKLMDTNYNRYENPYVKGGIVKRKPEKMVIEHNNSSLTLDFAKGKREVK